MVEIWKQEAPESLQTTPEADQEGEKGRCAALEGSRAAKAGNLTHHQPEIEAGGVDEEAFEDVRVTAQWTRRIPPVS